MKLLTDGSLKKKKNFCSKELDVETEKQ